MLYRHFVRWMVKKAPFIILQDMEVSWSLRGFRNSPKLDDWPRPCACQGHAIYTQSSWALEDAKNICKNYDDFRRSWSSFSSSLPQIWFSCVAQLIGRTIVTSSAMWTPLHLETLKKNGTRKLWKMLTLSAHIATCNHPPQSYNSWNPKCFSKEQWGRTRRNVLRHMFSNSGSFYHEAFVVSFLMLTKYHKYTPMIN